ncbi:MAG: hypothetical protein ACFHXK_08075 [bacterium]
MLDLTTSIDATRQDSIRFSGWLLDLLGLGIIAIGIAKKLDLFKDTSVWRFLSEGLLGWVRRFPLINRNVTLHLEPANLTSVSSDLDVSILGRLGKDATTERKIEFLIQRNEELTQDVHILRREAKQSNRELRSQVEELKQELSTSLTDLDSRTTDFHAGEIGYELVGLTWIFLGITFATVPELIELMFGGWLIQWFEMIGLWFGSFVA